MSFFDTLFRRPASSQPLSPLQDPVLGALKWDKDCEGWVADIAGVPAPATLYIGAGSASEYPTERLLALVREPFRSCEEHYQRALVYLEQNAAFSAWNVDPRQLIFAGIQTFEHYLASRTYTINFTAPDESIWKVHFRDNRPTQWGVDD